jgi:hypothetical protein
MRHYLTLPIPAPRPGKRLTTADVRSYPKAPRYDLDTLRTIFLQFESSVWEGELTDCNNTRRGRPGHDGRGRADNGANDPTFLRAALCTEIATAHPHAAHEPGPHRDRRQGRYPKLYNTASFESDVADMESFVSRRRQFLWRAERR